MYGKSFLLLAFALVPLVAGYGVPKRPPVQQEQVPVYETQQTQQGKQEITPILFPSDPWPEQQRSCPESTIYQKVTETQVVPSYVTSTLDHYVTVQQTQYETQYETISTTLVQPTYITETQYKTDIQTKYETEYATETVHKTQVVSSTYTQVDTTSIYVTTTEPHYVTNTYTVTETVTSAVPHYVTTTSQIEHYVTVTADCHAPVKNVKHGYGK